MRIWSWRLHAFRKSKGLCDRCGWPNSSGDAINHWWLDDRCTSSTGKGRLAGLHRALKTLNPTLDFHFLLTFSFVALPVIPALKLTDTGLFDVTTFQHISVEA